MSTNIWPSEDISARQKILRRVEVDESALAICQRPAYAMRLYSQRKAVPGFVYVVRADDDPGLYKIGISRNVSSRIGHLGRPVTPILVIRSNDFRGLEEWLCSRFRHCRSHGEWFRFSEGDLAELCLPA